MSAVSLTNTLTLRPMLPDDVHSVHAVEESSFVSPWPLSSYRFEVEQNKASRPLLAEVEQVDGSKQIVGLIVIWLLVDEAHIANIAVDPDYRRQGIACKLMQAALDDCAQNGAVYASLEVRSSNTAAQALYKRFGFESVGIRRAYYQDNKEDAILMTLQNLSEETISQMECETDLSA
ncbi:MAG: ribosomal-protein-alanine N-acetyltransferase [Chloroflexi bacterium]|nr:MAG: ribosomal-protein-alanine N-acetyltransferase [Chloroflexota bacterium]MBL1192825.1 ribosomal-protein-alanine N-acetyltransferase [Chloroflexota bacterium]NOH10118.1 ribosomal protein S18-alanine N-acetyltransferase [Chloroflexota bacterium]